MGRFRTGLKPRRFDPRVPHWSAYARKRAMKVAPLDCNNYGGMPQDSDILGNDNWGDCAEAATYREIEIMTFETTGAEVDATTDLALQLYSEATGFDPNAGAPGLNQTDQGTNLQDLLTFRVNTGVPLPNGGVTKLQAFFELDPRNLNDCRLAIWQGGVIQLGIECYDYMMNVAQAGVWAPPPANTQPSGGHAICSAWYDQNGFWVKTWAMDVYMPLVTWAEVVDEAYCVVSPEWVKATGQTPLGMSEDELAQAMAALVSTN